MAYVLGYWFADGGMRARELAGPEVYFVSNDREHLETIAEVIGAGNIHQVSRFRQGYRLNINRKEVYEDIVSLGGMEQKSVYAAWPYVPPEYLADFIRGYLDGDGWIGWKKNKPHWIPMISLYGTQAFVIGMTAAIESSIGVLAPTCRPHNGTWGATWRGIPAKCLTIWLYSNKRGISLHRKQIVADEIKQWQPLALYKSNITLKMRELFRDHISEKAKDVS